MVLDGIGSIGIAIVMINPLRSWEAPLWSLAVPGDPGCPGRFHAPLAIMMDQQLWFHRIHHVTLGPQCFFQGVTQPWLFLRNKRCLQYQWMFVIFPRMQFFGLYKRFWGTSIWDHIVIVLLSPKHDVLGSTWLRVPVATILKHPKATCHQ